MDSYLKVEDLLRSEGLKATSVGLIIEVSNTTSDKAESESDLVKEPLRRS